jgi:TRAP-type C4-dicarboxylate transport system permease small subunit
MALQVLQLLRRINQGVALVAGVVLLFCVAFILTDVVLRQLGTSLGGTTEISGYVMAGVTAWGMAYALLETAHVRIISSKLHANIAGDSGEYEVPGAEDFKQ